MADTPPHSQQEQHLAVDHLQNPTEPQETQPPSPPEPPHSETLETPDLPNPPQSQPPLDDQGVHNPQQSSKDEDSLMVLDEEDQHQHHQSGTIYTLPEPIILPYDTNDPPPRSPPPPITSPVNPQRRPYKRQKRGIRNPVKRKKSMMKVQNLTDILNPIPFIPIQTLDFDKHEDVLKRLGLWEFSKIEFDRSIRTDLVAQLIVNYDPKKRCSYVDELRIHVNRADLARALKLPTSKHEKGSGSGVEEVDLDSEVFSDEAIGFLEDFVLNWVLLHERSWVMPVEIANWTRCIKDGHPEKMDSASLIWYMVEKELTQGGKLVDCFYASHLQCLIRHQRKEILMAEMEVEDVKDEDDGDENVKAEEEKEAETKEENEEKEAEEENEAKEEKEAEEENGEKEAKDENEEKGAEEENKEKEAEEENEEKGAKEEDLSVVQEHKTKLTLGPDVEEVVHEEAKKDDEIMVDAAEFKEEGSWLLDGKNVLGEHFMQRCQSSNLNSYEERKPEMVEDEQIEPVEDEEEEEEEEIEQEEEERAQDGFDMEANDDSLDRDGLTDNFLHGVETSHIPYDSQGELRGMSSMDLFGSRDGSFMAHGGPSFYSNGGKRVMEPEEDIHHIDGNNKRLKTNEMWEQKPNDFGVCMEQMQQWMEKAKEIYESKEQSYENSQYNQQLEMNQLQERQNVMDIFIKSKEDELKKKNEEIFRLERELYLMGDLLGGYRKALNDTRLKFSEYRKRYALHEEPLYKDAGPGGLVLSTRELEKQRLKQEEDKMKFVMLAKNLEKEFVGKLEMYKGGVLTMVDRLMSVENEVKRVRELSAKRKEIQKPKDEQEHEPSVEPEENQKPLHEQERELAMEPEENQKPLNEQERVLSMEPEENQRPQDEVQENDNPVEGVLPDAAESKEPEGGGED